VTDREICCISALTPDGWTGPARIRIDRNGTIAEVSTVEVPGSTGALSGPLLPGMPNLHSHAFQRLMAGLTEKGGGEDTFWSWRDAMYRLAGRLTPQQVQAVSAWLQVEMLEAGYTSCAEFHYLHHQPDGRAYPDPERMSSALIAAAAESGMALTLLPVLYCRQGFDSDSVADAQKRFFNTPDQYLQLLQSCRKLLPPDGPHRLGIAPHSLRAVAPDQLRAVLEAPETTGLPVHIHIAEQIAEVEQAQHYLGDRPVQWLLEHFAVDASWCLVHATHMTAEEAGRAAASGAVAGLCPTTEADLGDGFFRAKEWLAAGGRFGIGSDSNLRVSVCEELRLLEFGCRLRSGRRNVLADEGMSCGRSLFQRAVDGGSRALGQNTGRIERGARADLIELDPDHPLLTGRSGDRILDGWLFAGGNSMVRTVWVGGVRCVDKGRHVPRSELREPFRRVMGELA